MVYDIYQYMCISRAYSEQKGDFMISRVQVILVVLIVLLVPTSISAKGTVFPDATIIDAGISYTLLAPSAAYLDQITNSPETRNGWALWPTVDVRMPIYQIGDSMLKLNVGIQPMFYIVHKTTQTNSYDTTYTDTDTSAYVMAEYSFPVKEGMDFTVGAGVRYHFWTYDYYYDSTITTDTSDYYVGSLFSLSFIFALDYMLETVPVRVALMPDLSYGLMIPLTISVGFPLGSAGQ